MEELKLESGPKELDTKTSPDKDKEEVKNEEEELLQAAATVAMLAATMCSIS